MGRHIAQELLDLRAECHRLFDQFWRSGMVSRREAYRKLALWLEVPESLAHFRMFDVHQCRRVIALLENAAIKPPRNPGNRRPGQRQSRRDRRVILINARLADLSEDMEAYL